MHPELASSLDRADELLTELEREYDRCLKRHIVSDRARNLTHEVLEKLRAVLDRTARLYWDDRVAPTLSPDDRAKAAVYFPITKDGQSLDSTLGRWRWRAVKDDHQELYDFFLAQQPFTSASNQWLAILNDIAVEGKHIGLVPQKRTEERRVSVERPGQGSVSWGPGVTFGRGVRIMGAPVDPTTQRIVPTSGVTERIEIWIRFILEGHDVNALGFCHAACRDTRALVSRMISEFDL